MMVVAAFVVVAALANAGTTELCASHVVPQSGDRLQTTAFQGVELYSWRTHEGPRFALLWGTNRNKTESEIKSPACVLSKSGRTQDCARSTGPRGVGRLEQSRGGALAEIERSSRGACRGTLAARASDGNYLGVAVVKSKLVP